jgi:hypothetical protein
MVKAANFLSKFAKFDRFFWGVDLSCLRICSVGFTVFAKKFEVLSDFPAFFRPSRGSKGGGDDLQDLERAASSRKRQADLTPRSAQQEDCILSVAQNDAR